MPKPQSTLEKLYTVKETAEYFGVTESTVLRWVKERQTSGGQKGLRMEMLNGKYRARESWIKDYARVLYPENRSA
jgi:excisionase family DNA binding protein